MHIYLLLLSLSPYLYTGQTSVSGRRVSLSSYLAICSSISDASRARFRDPAGSSETYRNPINKAMRIDHVRPRRPQG